ncbi:MAG: tetratricopeptide repeat protein, partial [Gammaproteobacteria bacterium]|nr:tetratricopeptide repeat protein [Gammaproteobacteria bacterium]
RVQSAEQLEWEDAWHENKRSFEGSFNARASNAYDLLQSDEPEKALEILESLISQRPNDKDVINDLSFAYSRLGEAEKAFEVLHKGLAIHPDYYLFHYNIADIYDWRGDLETALVHVDQAITLNPIIAAPYTRKGLLLTKQARFEEALAEFETALHYDESDPQVFFYAGQMAATLKRWPTAIQRFEESVRIDPSSALSHINLAGSLAYSDRFDEARAALMRAERLGTHAQQVQNALKQLAEQEASSK